MLRYKTKTRPGLVVLYDIRPGNGAGPFLQPRSLHGAPTRISYIYNTVLNFISVSFCTAYIIVLLALGLRLGSVLGLVRVRVKVRI